MDSGLSTKPGAKLALAALLLAAAQLVGGQLAAEPQDARATPPLEAAATLSPDLATAGWRLLAVPGKPPARFRGLGPARLQVSSAGGVAFLYRPLAPDESSKTRLTWDWRVISAPPPTDLSLKGGDDRPLALHLWFPEDPAEAGLWDGVKQTMGRLFDLPVPGKVLTYVWGGSQDQGTKLANPHLADDGVLIVLRSGQDGPGDWMREEIDIVADFTMAFGYPPPPALYLAISSDCDDNAGFAQGEVMNIRFEG